VTILPVINIRAGEVVRAVGCDPANFETLESDLCPTGDPLPLAFALTERFKCKEVHLVDWDGITTRRPNLPLISELVEIGLLPWVDAGVHDAADAQRIRLHGGAVVVRSDTIAGMEGWEQVVKVVDGRRLAFSLIMQDGTVAAPELQYGDALATLAPVLASANEIRADGPSRLFVLDQARAGQKQGFGHDMLLRRIVMTFPEIDIYAGGGIRGPKELARLDDTGIAGVVSATAVHSGKLQPGVQAKTAH